MIMCFWMKMSKQIIYTHRVHEDHRWMYVCMSQKWECMHNCSLISTLKLKRIGQYCCLFFSVKVVQLRLQWCMYSISIIKIKSTFSFSRVGLLTRKMSIGRRANKWHLFLSFKCERSRSLICSRWTTIDFC